VIPLRDTNPTSQTPIANRLLLAANVLVFVYTLTLLRNPAALDAFYQRYAFDWNEFTRAITGGDLSFATFVPLFTHMFVHGGWLHVLGNMLYLWIFGDNVEDRLGHFGFLLFYLACGTAAALGQMAVSLDSTMPMVGASGAIAGVMGAYFVLYPHSRVLTIVFLLFFMDMVEIPAIFFLGIWFIKEVFSGVGSLGTESLNGGVAFWAHVSGFAVGALVGVFRRLKEATERYRWD
jgi:membrane associated rhomboid family serine protease